PLHNALQIEKMLRIARKRTKKNANAGATLGGGGQEEKVIRPTWSGLDGVPGDSIRRLNRPYSEISRITRQGLPAAKTPSGISRVTTLPAPITDREPI